MWAHDRMTNESPWEIQVRLPNTILAQMLADFKGQIQPTSKIQLYWSTAHSHLFTYYCGCFQPMTELSDCNRNSMSHKAESIYDLDLDRKNLLTSAVGIHHQFIWIDFEDEIYQQSWNWVISRVSSRSKILNSNTPRTLCSYFLSMPNTPLQHLWVYFCSAWILFAWISTRLIPSLSSGVYEYIALIEALMILFKIGL